jgi:hypothetical protein
MAQEVLQAKEAVARIAQFEPWNLGCRIGNPVLKTLSVRFRAFRCILTSLFGTVTHK